MVPLGIGRVVQSARSLGQGVVSYLLLSLVVALSIYRFGPPPHVELR